jgi:diguanylate cyclase (GGDEF)-like protein
MGYAFQNKALKVVHPIQQARNEKLEKWLKNHMLNEKFLELELSQKLQSKLDIPSIASHFSEMLSTYVDHAGIQIDCSSSTVVTLEGQIAQYREVVDLILDNERLGHITLMSRQPINQWSAIFFRYLARYLVYPVKNAMLVESLHLQTITDPLTKAYNRTALGHDLAQELARSRRDGSDFTVVMLDIDHFKNINDSYGHQAGDHVLIELSAQVRDLIRESDSFYRYGGEEFTLLLRNIGPAESMKKVKAILAHCRTQPCTEIDEALRITLSAGIASWNSEDQENSLIQRADHALYISKESGRDQVNAA